MSSSELSNKVVVITGASSGIGKGVARDFAAAGAAVVLAARRDYLLTDLADELRALGGRVAICKADVSQWEEVAAIAATAREQFSRIDIWINNAGVGAIGRFDETPLEDHRKIIETNLLGTIYGSYMAMKQFRGQRAGVLINVSSALAKLPAPYYASYVASKFGILGLDAALRQEVAVNHEQDIHICTVMPMATDTPFFDHAANYTGRQAVPLPPLYGPQDAISAILECARNPTAEIVVGSLGAITTAAHSVAPGMVESYLAQQTHQAQIEKAPAAEFTAGALHVPSVQGTRVSGGRLET